MSDNYFTVMIAGMAKEGMDAYVKGFLTDLMQKSRQDEGCITYNIHQSTKNPHEFMLYSIWRDEAAFKRHDKTPHMQEFIAKLHKDLFVKESPKTYWKLID